MQSVSLNPRINYSVKCVLRVKNDCLFLSENHVGSQHCVPGAHFSSLEKLQVSFVFYLCCIKVSSSREEQLCKSCHNSSK